MRKLACNLALAGAIAVTGVMSTAAPAEARGGRALAGIVVGAIIGGIIASETHRKRHRHYYRSYAYQPRYYGSYLGYGPRYHRW